MKVVCQIALIVSLVAVPAMPAEESAATSAGHAVTSARLSALESEPGERSADDTLELAFAYDERGQLALARTYYEQAAARGIGVADLQLGWMAESGTGAEQSYAMARTHYERAVTRDVPAANLRLGLLALEGWGCPRDVTAAVRYLQAAANADYLPAQRILSEMYFSGIGVARDLPQALAWAQRAAAHQDPAAQTALGMIYEKAARLPEDMRAAREWYELSCEQDYAAGMLAMAQTFLKPGADPAQRAMGFKWLELAASGGNSAASFYLAGFYLWDRDLRQTGASQQNGRRLLAAAAAGGENVAREVLALADGGESLAAAYRYVMTVPYEDRYVQRLAVRPPTAQELALNLIPPRPLKTVLPVYPAAMLLARTDGQVMVEFVIDRTGRVRKAHAVSSTHQAFTDNAVAAVTAWRFLPGTKAGRPVNTRVIVPCVFQMKGVRGAVRSTAADGVGSK